MARPTTVARGLLRGLLLLLLVATLAVALVAFQEGRRLVAEVAESVTSRELTITRLELGRVLHPVVSAVRVAAAWGDAGRLEQGEGLRTLFQPLLQELPQISSVRVADAAGREYRLARGPQGWWSREVDPARWGDQARRRDWQGDGSNLRVAWEPYEGDPRREPWFRGGLLSQIVLGPSTSATDRPVRWSEPHRLGGTEAGITVSSAFGAGPPRKDVVALDVTLGDVSRFAPVHDPSPAAAVAVFTWSGRLLGAPRQGRFASGEARERALLRRSSELGWVLDRDSRRALASPQATDRAVPFSSDGEAYWGRQAWLALGSGRDLRIVAFVRERDLLAGLFELRRWESVVLLAVPVVVVLGLIVLVWRFAHPIARLAEQAHRVSVGDLDQAPFVTSRAKEIARLAEALEHIRSGLQGATRMENALQVARRIQRHALPDRIPYLRGFDIDGYSESAEETGGDTYDVIGYRVDSAGRTTALSVDNADRALLLLADATGHGVGPALSATQLRAMLRMAVRGGADLGHIVHNVNEQLCDDLFGGRFITAWLGILDAESAELTSFSAGQAPLFHHHAGENRTEIIQADGPPLGIARDLLVPLPPARTLLPGDIFAVVSDGVLEMANAEGEAFGEERAVEVIVRHREETAGLIVTRLRQAVDAFAPGMSHADDWTVVVVKREV